MLFSPYQRHHDPDVFPDPLRFDPDRWRTPSLAARAALLPLGAGNRTQVHRREVALTELVLTVASVASRFQLRPVAGAVVRPVAHASLGTTRVMMTPQPCPSLKTLAGER
jgi:cytochrome P450